MQKDGVITAVGMMLVADRSTLCRIAGTTMFMCRNIVNATAAMNGVTMMVAVMADGVAMTEVEIMTGVMTVDVATTVDADMVMDTVETKQQS